MEEKLVRELSGVAAIELRDNLTHDLDHWVGLSRGNNISQSELVDEVTGNVIKHVDAILSIGFFCYLVIFLDN